jgi:hypothetical protein
MGKGIKMKIKAPVTFFIGLFVLVANLAQCCFAPSLGRAAGIFTGLFVLLIGWKLGWTTHRRFTVLVGHIVVAIGAFVTAYAVYQIPFIEIKPSILEVAGLPLFWGIFCILGGICMINHGHCNCTIAMHNRRNEKQ